MNRANANGDLDAAADDDHAPAAGGGRGCGPGAAGYRQDAAAVFGAARSVRVLGQPPQESSSTPARRLTYVKVIRSPGAHRRALRGRMREPGRISEESSIQCDADGSGPRTIRDELPTGHPGHYFARSRAARPSSALGGNGIQRAEYTIGVTGCGRRETFVVICPQFGDGCFAAGP